MPIKVLSSDVINQIAAGEVVERPAHLVKELIENSLDANADQIIVDISEGGRFIRVSDNGDGISSSELGQALQRHATSKITKTGDLWNLNSFGFRGEALASAAAVSRLNLHSIEKSESKPSQIISEFGKISNVMPSSLTKGTDIKIESLFENVPARLKFLKTESAELGQIKSVIKAMALAHPQVEFKLTHHGNLIFYFSKKSSKLARAQDVLEVSNLFEANSESDVFKCHVVFASPQEVNRTAKQIWIFVQNRWIQDRALQAAILDAYRSLLMHGEYPNVALYLDCKPDFLDVNIHPTKSQVKFQDPAKAFKIVQNTLRSALEKAPWIPQNINQSADDQSMIVKDPTFVDTSSYNSNMSFSDHALNRTFFRSKEYVPYNKEILQTLKVDTQDVSADNLNVSKNSYWSNLQIIGQVNLTYLVCQKQDAIVYVDQHAAHERVVYESLMESWREGKFEIQNYLFPLAIDLTEEKIEAIKNEILHINKMGFEIEQLGPQTLGVKSAPALVKETGLPLVFEKLSQEILQHGGSHALEKNISDLFATMACHSVVRAGQSMSVSEMHQLLKSMDQYSLSSFCPHGRPVSVEIKFTDLEKQFGRIN